MERETIKPTNTPGLLVVERKTFPDERGLFREVFRKDELEAALGYEFNPVQMNHSVSNPGVIRGLHAENWNKLIYPTTGNMFAALVDIRPDSPNFGNVETFNFDTSAGRQALFIPKGIANSICVLGDQEVNYIYLVDDYYDGSDTTAIAWDDPDLNIKWPITNPIISDRDLKNQTIREMFPNKFKNKWKKY